MDIVRDIYSAIVDKGMTITDLHDAQHFYHEHRRWSLSDVLRDRQLSTFTDQDVSAVLHSAKAEITTQPACLRMARLGGRLAEEHRNDPVARTVAHAIIQWSSRYWLQEEAHHEVVFRKLLADMGGGNMEETLVYDHRGDFPDDNLVRVCILQACVEVEAIVTYGGWAKRSTDPLVRDIFLNVTRDEVQHRQYFISFAKALIDAGIGSAKDALAMAYTWIRPKGGETHGSAREKQSQREGYVNWWEGIDRGDRPGAMVDDMYRSEGYQAQKTRSVLAAVSEVIGERIETFEALQSRYFLALRAKAA